MIAAKCVHLEATTQSTNIEIVLQDYILSKNKAKGEIRSTWRFAHANIIAYAFQTITELHLAPKSFSEVITSEECKSWQVAIKEEMKSFDKNNTYMVDRRRD